MSCIYKYKGKKYSEEQFKEYFINNKQEFATSIAKNKDVMDSFKRKIEGIDYVFSQSPELASIGNKAQYLQYLSTIFKTSQVKDIVYRADKRTNLTSQTTVDDYTQVYVNGVYYTTELDYVDNYNKELKGKIYPTILNIVNPAEIKTKQDIERLGRNKTEFERINKLKYSANPKDSLIFDNTIYKTKDKYGEVGKEIVVFEPEQIHVMGSKNDIQGFKEFVQGKQFQEQSLDNLLPSNNDINADYLKNKINDTNKEILERKKEYQQSIKIENTLKSRALSEIEEKNNILKEKLLPLGFKEKNKELVFLTNSYITLIKKQKELSDLAINFHNKKINESYELSVRPLEIKETYELQKTGKLPFTPMETKKVIEDVSFLDDLSNNIFEGLSDLEKDFLKEKIKIGEYKLTCKI